jgi:centrosomal protein CEP164
VGGDSIILEEEIDPNYVPTEEEVLEYAKWLGMDLQDDRVSQNHAKFS